MTFIKFLVLIICISIWGIIAYAIIKPRKTKVEFVGNVNDKPKRKPKETWFKKMRKNVMKAVEYTLQLERIEPVEEKSELTDHGKLQKLQRKNSKQLAVTQKMQIVDVIKPIGEWTLKIFNEQKDLIMASLIANKKSHQGFWVNYIKARNAMTKNKGKSRD